MLVSEVKATRRNAKWSRGRIRHLIEKHRFRYSEAARRYYEMVGRCAVYVNTGDPVPREVLEAVEDVPTDSALEAIEEYDPEIEGVILWVPTDPPEGSPLGGMVLSGRFELHPAFRVS